MTIVKALKDYIIGLQHVGHVVADLEAAVDGFRKLYGADDVRYVPEKADVSTPTRFAFVTVGDVEFEIIQPVSEESRAMLLATPSGGAGINHVAWRVTDLDACLAVLADQGIGPGHVTPDGPVQYGEKRLVYLDPAACGGLLVELIGSV